MFRRVKNKVLCVSASSHVFEEDVNEQVNASSITIVILCHHRTSIICHHPPSPPLTIIYYCHARQHLWLRFGVAKCHDDADDDDDDDDDQSQPRHITVRELVPDALPSNEAL